MAAHRSDTDDWGARAETLLEGALDSLRDGHDVIPEVTEALTALYLSMGEKPLTVRIDAAEYAERAQEDRDHVPICTCRPGLVEQGGFSSSCPTHGVGHG
jgi:hypothetical protein